MTACAISNDSLNDSTCVLPSASVFVPLASPPTENSPKFTPPPAFQDELSSSAVTTWCRWLTPMPVQPPEFAMLPGTSVV